MTSPGWKPGAKLLGARRELGALVVQKFGGTSVATESGRERACHHVLRAMQEGSLPVVVVSAMGRRGDPYATDTLLGVARSINPTTAPRELDLLASCGEVISAVVLASMLHRRGQHAVALTGAQAGIITDNHFTDARILRVEPDEVFRQLRLGHVVVVAGFQGVTETGDITTLGRGGSDTTAAALGVALNADVIDIYTDVSGVKTADPMLVPEAKTMKSITYEELAQMAHAGARVLHPRAIELAMEGGVPLRVRSTFEDESGTVVTHAPEPQATWPDYRELQVITGVTQFLNRTQIVIKNDEQSSSVRDLDVFDVLAENGISLDLINVDPDRRAFIVRRDQADRAEELLRNLGLTPRLRHNCAKVSVVGMGMRGVPGVMANVVRALTDAGIQILQCADSHVTISCLIDGTRVQEALRALVRQFRLD